MMRQVEGKNSCLQLFISNTSSIVGSRDSKLEHTWVHKQAYIHIFLSLGYECALHLEVEWHCLLSFIF